MIAPLQVPPLSVERETQMFAFGALRSFQEIYMFPKKGEPGSLSAQPDSRSSPPLGWTQKCVQLFGSEGSVDLNPPSVQPPFPSNHTVNQVCVGLLYSITGSPNVFGNGL